MKYCGLRFVAGVVTSAIFFVFSFSHAHAQVVRAITFPVSGKYSFRDDFAELRGDGTREHLGIDIIADKMTPVVAAVDGTVTFLAIPQASWGYAITIRDSEGYSYRYLHINNDTPGTNDGQGGEANAYAPGIQRGVAVTRGQHIGWVGDSGNAEGTVSHLHFEIRNSDRTTVNPFATLLAASGNQTQGQSTLNVVHTSEGGLEDEERFIAVRNLREGMTDPDVATLHAELKVLGYYSGTTSETYSAVTREAVRHFQNANGLEPTGLADVLTRKALTAAAKLVPVSPPPAPPSNSAPSLSQGSEGRDVRALQQRLKDLEFFSSYVTGYFGPITHSAVVAFQKTNGIEPIGVVGPKTRSVLDVSNHTPSASSFLFTKLLEPGARGEEVRQLQTRLQREGYFNDEPTGYFGAITRAAVVAFQNARGIEPLGIVGPKTRASLNESF